ncbi:hypothetical protein TIFTF001_027385, partial [Ficus carica]
MDERRMIQHFSHEHDLEFYGEVEAEVPCFICDRLFGGRHDPSGYICSDVCYYFIHKKCAELPQHINHSLHALHLLTLAQQSVSSSSCCYYCEKPFENEVHTYACDQCSNFHMHTSCAVIPLPMILTSHDVDGGQYHNVVQYACHYNPMILVEHEDERREELNALPVIGPAYSCTLTE